ncbi:hypothetical protein [Methylobacterium sp. CM6257]
MMKPSLVEPNGHSHAGPPSKQALDTRQLGLTLRTVYEGSVDTQPITDTHVELLLRLRQKERELRRAS